MPCPRRTSRRVIEHLADHHRQLVSPLIIARPQLVDGELDRLGGGRLQGSFLLAPTDERGQPLLARIGQQPNQPRSKSVSNKSPTAIARLSAATVLSVSSQALECSAGHRRVSHLRQRTSR